MGKLISFTHRSRTSVGSHADQVSFFEMTDIVVDGARTHSIVWNPALLRRLEREGITREEYANRIADRYRD